MSFHPKRGPTWQDRSWQVKAAVARSNGSGCGEDEDDDASLDIISPDSGVLEGGWSADVGIWIRLRKCSL